MLEQLYVATSQVTQAAERCSLVCGRLAAAHAERDALRQENAALIADKELLLALVERAAAAVAERRREAQLAALAHDAERVSSHEVVAPGAV